MTIRIYETQESRTLRDGFEVNQKGIDLEFVAWDDAMTALDEEDVEDAVVAVVNAAPFTDPYKGLYRQTIQCRPLARHIFQCTVTYGAYDKQELRFGFTTAGGTEHVTHSLSTIARYYPPPYTSAPDFGGAVNVTPHGIQGYQRAIPQLAFWVTAFFDPGDWTAAEWFNIADLSFTWNLAIWNGWPAKSVLLEFVESPEIILGQTQLVPVKFYFKAKRPETVAPATGISFTKDPWDLVWHDYVPTTDNAAKALAHKIRSTHREQIFSGVDATLWGLG